MASPDDLIPAAAASTAVVDFANSKDPADIARASYRRIWAGISNGTIRAERVGGRWFLRRSELPAIAAALGLTRANSASPSSNAKAAA